MIYLLWDCQEEGKRQYGYRNVQISASLRSQDRLNTLIPSTIGIRLGTIILDTLPIPVRLELTAL
jgi:hypothetical protein